MATIVTVDNGKLFLSEFCLTMGFGTFVLCAICRIVAITFPIYAHYYAIADGNDSQSQYLTNVSILNGANIAGRFCGTFILFIPWMKDPKRVRNSIIISAFSGVVVLVPLLVQVNIALTSVIMFLIGAIDFFANVLLNTTAEVFTIKYANYLDSHRAAVESADELAVDSADDLDGKSADELAGESVVVLVDDSAVDSNGKQAGESANKVSTAENAKTTESQIEYENALLGVTRTYMKFFQEIGFIFGILLEGLIANYFDYRYGLIAGILHILFTFKLIAYTNKSELKLDDWEESYKIKQIIQSKIDEQIYKFIFYLNENADDKKSTKTARLQTQKSFRIRIGQVQTNGGGVDKTFFQKCEAIYNSPCLAFSGLSSLGYGICFSTTIHLTITSLKKDRGQSASIDYAGTLCFLHLGRAICSFIPITIFKEHRGWEAFSLIIFSSCFALFSVVSPLLVKPLDGSIYYCQEFVVAFAIGFFSSEVMAYVTDICLHELDDISHFKMDDKTLAVPKLLINVGNIVGPFMANGLYNYTANMPFSIAVCFFPMFVSLPLLAYFLYHENNKTP